MPKTLKFQKLFLETISNIFYVTFVTYMRYNCRHVGNTMQCSKVVRQLEILSNDIAQGEPRR